MKKYFIAISFFASVLIFSSCGSTIDLTNTAAEIQSHYKSLKSCTLEADLTADLNDRIFNFTLVYSEIEGNGGEVTVLSPEEISGVKAKFEPGGTKLIYSDTTLEIGAMPNTKLTPLSALPAMLGAWRDGYLVEQNDDIIDNIACAELVWTATLGSETLIHRAWFDAGNFEPVKAEISAGDRVVISCTFK